MFRAFVEHQFLGLVGHVVDLLPAGVRQAGVGLAVHHQQLAGGDLSGHARAVGLGREGNYPFDVSAVGPSGDDYGPAK